MQNNDFNFWDFMTLYWLLEEENQGKQRPVDPKKLKGFRTFSMILTLVCFVFCMAAIIYVLSLW